VRRCSFVREILLHWFFLQVACFFDKGDRYRRTSMQAAVDCEISKSKELQNN
jgi:hypothetical protein